MVAFYKKEIAYLIYDKDLYFVKVNSIEERRRYMNRISDRKKLIEIFRKDNQGVVDSVYRGLSYRDIYVLHKRMERMRNKIFQDYDDVLFE